MFNVIAQNWTNGKYCLGMHVKTREEAQAWATLYTARYEGKPFPNGRGYYECRNFRVVEIECNAVKVDEWETYIKRPRRPA